MAGLLSGDQSGAALVRHFWACCEARRWDEAQALLSPGAQCLWWASRERWDGAVAVVRVNALYPEGWNIRLLELNVLADGRVHSLVRVDRGEVSFHANSVFSVEADVIIALEEYWADVQEPPAWRQDDLLPGRRGLPRDRRSGAGIGIGIDLGRQPQVELAGV